MICKLNDALGSCEQYRDEEGFCTRNCSCSGMIFGGNQAVYDEARKGARKYGVERYNVVSGSCGDWYIVERDEMGRLI